MPAKASDFKINLRMPHDLNAALERRCIEDAVREGKRISKNEVILRAIRSYLDKPPRKRK